MPEGHTKVAGMLNKIGEVPTGAVIGIDSAGRLPSAATIDQDGNMVKPIPIHDHPTYEELKAAVQGCEDARKKLSEAKRLWLPQAP